MNPEYLKVRDLLEGLQLCDPDSCVQVGNEIVRAGKAPTVIRRTSYPFLVAKIDHESAAIYKGARDDLAKRIIDLCNEFEESEVVMSTTKFIAQLRKAAQ